MNIMCRVFFVVSVSLTSMVACGDSTTSRVETAGMTSPPSSSTPSAGLMNDRSAGIPAPAAGHSMAGNQNVPSSMDGPIAGTVNPIAGAPALAGARAVGGAGQDVSAGASSGGDSAGGQMVFAGQVVGGMFDGGSASGGIPVGGATMMAGEPAIPQLVDYCRFQGPSGASVNPGDAFDVFGLVYEEGVTDRTNGTDVDDRLWAEGGYGPRGTVPVDNADWTWQRAVANPAWNAPERNEVNNDEYMASLTIPRLGDYDLAFRFTIDGGQNWLYCDRGTGSTDGYSVDRAGLVAVVPVKKGDYCRIQAPLEHAGQPGETLAVYGNIYQDGITDRSPQVDAADNIVVEAGYGPRETDPDGNRSWTWTRSVGNPEWNGVERGEANNDEYVAQVTLPTTGSYDLAVRFSIDNGLNWLYCDQGDGSTNGYSPADAARLTTSCPDGLREACRQCLGPDKHCLDLAEGNNLISVPVILDDADNSVGGLFADPRIVRVAGGYSEANRNDDGMWVGDLADGANGGIRPERAYWVTTSEPVTLILDGSLKTNQVYALAVQPDGLSRCPDDLVCVNDTCIDPSTDAGGAAAGGAVVGGAAAAVGGALAGGAAAGGAVAGGAVAGGAVGGGAAAGGAAAIEADAHMAGGHRANDGPRPRACDKLINWVSFPGLTSRTLDDALPAEARQRIVSIFGQGLAAVRRADGTWAGNLQTFEPMKGYLFEVSGDVSFQFVVAE